MPTPLLSKEELLASLCQTFRRYGYEGATMTRISQATGLGKASLYHYFPAGKTQMAASVIEFVQAWFETHIFSPLESVHPPRQRIESMLETLNHYYSEGQLGCLPGLLAQTEERSIYCDGIRSFFSRWVASLSQTLTDAGLARDIAQRRAYDAVERIQGTLILCRAFGDDRPFVAMVAELPDHLLAGSGRSTVWTTRAPRFPATPSVPLVPSRAV